MGEIKMKLMMNRRCFFVYIVTLVVLFHGCTSYDSHEYFGDKKPYFEICCETNNGSIEGVDNQGEDFYAPVDYYREIKPYLYAYGEEGYIIVNCNTREIIKTKKLKNLTEKQRKIFSEEDKFHWITDYESVKAIRDSKIISNGMIRGRFRSKGEIKEYYYIPKKTGSYFIDLGTEDIKSIYDVEIFDSDNRNILMTTSRKKQVKMELKKGEKYHIFLTQNQGMEKYIVMIQEKTVVKETILPEKSIWKVSIFPTGHFENSYNIFFATGRKLYTQVGRREGDEVVNGSLKLKDYQEGGKILSINDSKDLENMVNKIMCSDINKISLEETIACIDDGWIMTVEKGGTLVYSPIYNDKNMSKFFEKLTKYSAVKIDINGGWGGLP